MDVWEFLIAIGLDSWMGLDDLVKTLNEDDFDLLKKELPDKWEYLKEN